MTPNSQWHSEHYAPVHPRVRRPVRFVWDGVGLSCFDWGSGPVEDNFSLRFRPVIPVLGQDAVGVAFRVVELAGAHGPDEGGEADGSEEEGDGDQDDKDFHWRGRPYFSRMAFRETVIEDKDIAKAAARGVAEPISAKGTAMTL